MLDYLGLKAEISLSKYEGLTDTQIAASLVAVNITTSGSALLSPDAFVDLFTAEEVAAVLDCTDPLVRKFMLRLRTRNTDIDLAGATVLQGLAYLSGQTKPAIASPILTPERAATIGTVPAGPMISRAEQLGFGSNNDMAQEIAAARKFA